MYDPDDTIVAAASAPGPAPRGVVRVAGPLALEVVEALTLPARLPRTGGARRVAGLALRIPLGGAPRPLPCDVLVWPDTRSYTRQPAVEVHAVGSPPVVAAVVRALVASGARLAEPGEFTFRALAAGRIDLLQAEAVMAVVEARGAAELGPALSRLAGGMSGPLRDLRAELVSLAADIEAGLDFVDERDVTPLEREALARRLATARIGVAEAIGRLGARGDTTTAPSVVLVGPANAGKSSLFNALAACAGGVDAPRALVADRPGVTRDAVVARLRCGGAEFDLIDTAGDPIGAACDAPADEIDRAARRAASERALGADLILRCTPPSGSVPTPSTDPRIVEVLTQADRLGTLDRRSGLIATSCVSGEGVAALLATVAARLTGGESATDSPAAAGHASARCRASLDEAAAALDRAEALARCAGGDELVAFELRSALDAVGRVVGAVSSDELLGEVFSRFCIGK